MIDPRKFRVMTRKKGTSTWLDKTSEVHSFEVTDRLLIHDLSADCPKLPAFHNRRDLGNHSSCATAVAEARRIYRRSNGCYWCARTCHTS